jgi:2-aminobenzoate-CoA ligase
MPYSAHVDTFTRDNLPPPDQQPEFLFDLPELKFPERLNCSDPLLDSHVAEGRGDRLCIQAPGVRWTYADLQQRANRIANVLVNDLGIVPGNRVLLRAPNNPMMAACWFAVMKVGAVATATMPLLRAKELKHVIAKAKVTHALCDLRLAEELKLAAVESPDLKHIRWFNDNSPDGLEAAMAKHSPVFVNVDTARDDTCILAFTSGTTGQPKATMHFHRDVMASCVCWPPHVLRPVPDDIFMGTPPLAFTFGLGGLLLFRSASAPRPYCWSRARRRTWSTPSENTRPPCCSPRRPPTAPSRRSPGRCATVRCASASRPARPCRRQRARCGRRPRDRDDRRHRRHRTDAHLHLGRRGRGAAGRDRQGGSRLPRLRHERRGQAGRRRRGRQAGGEGPTGCRYLADERQASYVKNGWNYTGDAYSLDADGYYHYHSRTDDMIISAGYNIAGPEVEDALAAPPEGGRVRRDRRRRRGARPDRQGLRRAAPGHRADARTGEGIAGLRQADHRPLQVSPQRRIRQFAAAYRNRQAARFRLRQSS